MKICSAVIFLALALAGCSEQPNESGSFGCLYAYDESYECYAGQSFPSAPVYQTKNGQECSEFAKNLGSGVFWLEGMDGTGEKFIRKEVVGEDGWRSDGVVRSDIIYAAGLSSWSHTVCRLEDVSFERVRGSCGAYYFPRTNCGQDESSQDCLQKLQCSKRDCHFSFLIGASYGAEVFESVKCLLPYPEELRDTVKVFVADSAVLISIPNVTVTWTKRPGL